MSSRVIKQQFGLMYGGSCSLEFDTRAKAERYREINALWQHTVVVREVECVTKVGRWTDV